MLAAWAVVLGAASATGCANRVADANRPPAHPVVGRLTVDGRPVANARLALHPVGGGLAVRPVGFTRPDGTFRLTTYAADDGAPAGEYVVTVIWTNEAVTVDECECPDPATHDRLRGRYATAAVSDLRVTIRPGDNSVALRATAGAAGWDLPPVRPRGSAGARPG